MILVTGGLGFIGLHTVRRLLDMGEEVVATYHRAWAAPSFLESEYGKRVHVEQMDLTNPYTIFQIGSKYNITGIVHLVVPPLGASPPSEQYRINTMALYNVLEAGRVWGVKRVTIASSVAVYSGETAGPFKEDMKLRIQADNTTEAFKKAEETMALFYGSATGLDVVSARIAFIFGPMYNKQLRLRHIPMTFIQQACRAAVDGKPFDPDFIPDGGFSEGTAMDFTYVKDTALGLATLQTADSLPNHIYNVSIGSATTLREVVQAVQKVRPDAQIPLNDGTPPGVRPDAYLDIGLIQKDTGFKPEYGLEGGIADYMAWLEHNAE